jgi:phosphate starvation-inducible PhoH-like protein
MVKRTGSKKRNNKQKQPIRPARKKLKPKSENQYDYIDEISENDLTFCSGPAGSGKTAVAVGMACEYMLGEKIDKIVVSRPVIESGRGLGFLPGSMNEKVHPYMVPIIEEMKLYLGRETYNSMRATNQIEVCPLEYMRGRNFHNSFMILDEAQNATYEQIKMFMTRIGIASKAVINGDLDQTDLRGGHSDESSGLQSCMDRLEDLEGVGICYLSSEDIVRNKIISRVLNRLK